MKKDKEKVTGEHGGGPDPVEAFVAPDAGALALAKSLLESAGIPYFVKNENAQHLLGGGQLGTGYNLVVGPPVIMVEAAHAEAAQELLSSLTQPAAASEDEQDG